MPELPAPGLPEEIIQRAANDLAAIRTAAELLASGAGSQDERARWQAVIDRRVHALDVLLRSTLTTIPRGHASTHDAPDRASASVLVVMQNSTIAAPIMHELQGAGYRVRHARRGLDALLAIEEDRPALVLLDWGMPGIDGPTFLSILAGPYMARTGVSAPPVIALVHPSDDPRQVQRAGVELVLPLSPQPAVLLEAVQVVLARTAA